MTHRIPLPKASEQQLARYQQARAELDASKDRTWELQIELMRLHKELFGERMDLRPASSGQSDV